MTSRGAAVERWPELDHKASEIVAETIRAIQWYASQPIKTVEPMPYQQQMILEMVIRKLEKSV